MLLLSARELWVGRPDCARLAATMATLSYLPTEAETKRFWDLDSATAKAQVEVPTGFPKRLESSLAWSGNEIEGKDAQWTIVLTAEDVVLIEAALRKFEGGLLFCCEVDLITDSLKSQS